VSHPVHRFATVDGGKIVATALPCASHLVRFHPDAELPYDRMIVVTELDAGRILFLSGWIGPPLGVVAWRIAKAELFPSAELVMWERRRRDGSARLVRFAI
jgi:hypothetical protein